jgi:tRNA-dihydrouridine synthase
MLGNPWLIGTILDECQGKRKINISNEDKLGVIEEHLHLLIQEKGEYTGIREMITMMMTMMIHRDCHYCLNAM